MRKSYFSDHPVVVQVIIGILIAVAAIVVVSYVISTIQFFSDHPNIGSAVLIAFPICAALFFRKKDPIVARAILYSVFVFAALWYGYGVLTVLTG